MELRYVQTEVALRHFHQNFEKSRSEMIDRLLQDQDNLNKKFAEYNFSVDDIEQDSLRSEQNQVTGVTAEDLHMNFRKDRGRDCDGDSVRSLQTECSFTDSSEDEASSKKPVKTIEKSSIPSSRPTSATRGKETVCQKLSLSTPRFEKPERKLEKKKAASKPAPWVEQSKTTPESSSFGRSKSLRVPGSTKSSPSTSSTSRPRAKKIEQPPNSPEIARKQESVTSGKPPLHNIRTGRKPTEKSEKPRKLLVKRQERPSTAMGLCSPGHMSLTPEVEYQSNERVPDGSNPWETDSVTTSVRTGVSVRSAPLPFRQKVVSWESEQLKDNYHSFVSRRNSTKVPPIPSNLSQGTDSGNPSYAQTYDTSVDTNRPRVSNDNNNGERVRFRSVTPTYGHTYESTLDKPRNTQDKVKAVSRSKSINVKPFTKSQSDYFSSNKMGDVDSNCVNLWDQETYDQGNIKKVSSKASSDSQGQLRRYKGHGNLSRSEQARGAQVAVLKLPPVSKKQAPDIPKRSGTSLAYYGGQETTMMKMMPVHIGEEF